MQNIWKQKQHSEKVLFFTPITENSENVKDIFYPKKVIIITENKKINTVSLCCFRCHFKQTLHTRGYLQILCSPGSWAKPNRVQSWERPILQPGSERCLYLQPSGNSESSSLSRCFFAIDTTDGPKYVNLPWKQEGFAFFHTQCASIEETGIRIFVCLFFFFNFKTHCLSAKLRTMNHPQWLFARYRIKGS